jgi:hypothetical protein
VSKYLRRRPGSNRITVSCQDDLYDKLQQLKLTSDLTSSGIVCKLLRSHPDIQLPPIE